MFCPDILEDISGKMCDPVVVQPQTIIITIGNPIKITIIWKAGQFVVGEITEGRNDRVYVFNFS